MTYFRSGRAGSAWGWAVLMSCALGAASSNAVAAPDLPAAYTGDRAPPTILAKTSKLSFSVEVVEILAGRLVIKGTARPNRIIKFGYVDLPDQQTKANGKGEFFSVSDYRTDSCRLHIEDNVSSIFVMIGNCGPKGDRGDAGPSGPQGPVGPRGSRGPAFAPKINLYESEVCTGEAACRMQCQKESEILISGKCVATDTKGQDTFILNQGIDYVGGVLNYNCRWIGQSSSQEYIAGAACLDYGN